MTSRPRITMLAIALLALVVAVPVLAAKPSAPPGQQTDKPEKAPITLNGTIETSTDADGNTIYTLVDGGITYTLEAGPTWLFDDDYPLDAYVGRGVTVEGEIAEGSSEVDVIAVDGTALRGEGKPPWAGGWKHVGEGHPGWSQEKADRFEAKHGGCWPPGHCKDETPADTEGGPETD